MVLCFGLCHQPEVKMKKKTGILALAGAAGAGAVAVGVGAGMLYSKTVKRPKEVSQDIIDEFADGEKMAAYMASLEPVHEWMDRQIFEDIFITADDGIKLHAMYLPAGDRHEKIAIILHGFTSKAEDELFHIKAFYDMGFDILALDLRAHGKSEGKYVGFGILDRFDTLLWIRYVRERFGKEEKIILHGTSMGATTALMALGIPEVRNEVSAAIADCAFTSPDAIFSHVMKKDYHLPSFPFMSVYKVMTKYTAGYRGDDYSTLEALKENDSIPVLFIHGSEDKFVPVWMVEQNYEACRTEKEKLIVEGGGHGSSAFENPELYIKTEQEFLAKVLR